MGKASYEGQDPPRAVEPMTMMSSIPPWKTVILR
jgi:hypothetical protein